MALNKKSHPLNILLQFGKKGSIGFVKQFKSTFHTSINDISQMDYNLVVTLLISGEYVKLIENAMAI